MEHDYQKARRGAVLSSKGKTRVTMYLDDDVLQYFRQKAFGNGRGYQTEINANLRDSMNRQHSLSNRERNSVSINISSVLVRDEKVIAGKRVIQRDYVKTGRAFERIGARFAGGRA